MSATEAYFVTRTMRALELLAFGPLSARELAAALQVHERTARRIFSRLLDEEYVTRLDEPRRRYVLTMRVAALTSASGLVGVAAPIVALLHTETALTAQLVSPSYDCVLCVAQHANGGVVGEHDHRPGRARGAGVGDASAGLCERGRRVPRRGPGSRGARARPGGRGDRRARRPRRHGRSADPVSRSTIGYGGFAAERGSSSPNSRERSESRKCDGADPAVGHGEDENAGGKCCRAVEVGEIAAERGLCVRPDRH